MRHLPIFIDIRGRDVLVVGGEGAAERKAEALAGAGARLTVVAGPAARPASPLAVLAESTGGALHHRGFRPDDVAGKALVVCASEDEALNLRVSRAAQGAGVPVNVVDRPALSTFIWPAVVDRDPITVAVSSAGTAPVLARRVRARIEAMLPANLGALARFAESFRAAVKATRPSGLSRRRFWERFFDGPVADAVLAGDERRARERMLASINRREDAGEGQGVVYLVGAGPGDPELLTLKAARLLQQADVIVYDRLVGPRVLEHARRDAGRIYVGKARGSHARTQDEINALLAELAGAGQRVVRLKGGDPFVFGRGGEEREYLLARGIACEVVPGITAATGCAAAAGIPLTHREQAQALSIVTAQGKDGAAPDLDWRALAQGGQTLAVYMGASSAGQIAARLIAHGRAASTPVAVIASGTLPQQRVVVGALDELPALAPAAGESPVLILVGDVVRHAAAWAERERPLALAN